MNTERHQGRRPYADGGGDCSKNLQAKECQGLPTAIRSLRGFWEEFLPGFIGESSALPKP